MIQFPAGEISRAPSAAMELPCCSRCHCKLCPLHSAKSVNINCLAFIRPLALPFEDNDELLKIKLLFLLQRCAEANRRRPVHLQTRPMHSERAGAANFATRACSPAHRGQIGRANGERAELTKLHAQWDLSHKFDLPTNAKRKFVLIPIWFSVPVGRTISE